MRLKQQFMNGSTQCGVKDIAIFYLPNNTKEKGRQFFLFDILPNKNLGVNTLRSIYVSYGYQN